jgi:hypothetical protein
MSELELDAGSFRDPGGRVVTQKGRIFRVVSRHSLEDWRAFSASPLFDELQRDALLIPTRPAPADLAAELAATDPGAVVLEHDRVPFLSYPYEWSFSMLRDAALLQLELVERALARDFVLKDASPYNVQFLGARPVFIDVLSFARYQPGDPWAGYNQFCKLMLYPLMLEAYKGVGFQAWLRSELEGLDPLTFSRLFGLGDLLRPGVFSHVKLHAWLQRRAESRPTSVRREIRRAGLSRDALLANLRGLRRLLLCLRPAAADSHWVEYEQTCTYDAAALSQKEDFVRRVASSRQRSLAWDLGANVGRFSRLAAEHAEGVVALDTDAASVDRLYLALKQERRPNILPLVMNVANLSPDQGWRGRERRSLVARGKPELVLALALVHHLRISANIPVAAFLDWLAELGAELVLEFVSKDDPQTRRLLLNKDDTYDDYTREAFEAALEKLFRLEATLALPGGTRVLYHAVPLGHAS